MSDAEAFPAARATDPIAHGLGILGLIGGAVLGAVVGAALVTPPGIIAAIVIVGAVSGGALAGQKLIRAAAHFFELPDPQTGVIDLPCSPDVRVGGLPSARAKDDHAKWCHGLWGLSHIPLPSIRIAEGSKTVAINNLPAARTTCKLQCGAAIKSGDSTVLIGGPTVRVLWVLDTEKILETVFTIGSYGSMIALGVLFPFSSLPILAGYVGVDYTLGWLGNQLGEGYADLFQGLFGILTLILPNGVKTPPPPKPQLLLPPPKPQLLPPPKPQLLLPPPKPQLLLPPPKPQLLLPPPKPQLLLPPPKPQLLLPPPKPQLLLPPPSKATQARLEGLAKDPAQGGKATLATYREAEAGLALEGRGDLPGPIKRSEHPGAEFIDGNGQAWDVKAYTSHYPNGFVPQKIEMQIAHEFAAGENVILDTRNLTTEDRVVLKKLIDSKGWGDRVLWYP